MKTEGAQDSERHYGENFHLEGIKCQMLQKQLKKKEYSLNLIKNVSVIDPANTGTKIKHTHTHTLY